MTTPKLHALAREAATFAADPDTPLVVGAALVVVTDPGAVRVFTAPGDRAGAAAAGLFEASVLGHTGIRVDPGQMTIDEAL